VPELAGAPASEPEGGEQMGEAATIKASVKAAVRALDNLLAEKTVPDGIRLKVKELRGEFSKTWADLESEAGGRTAEAAENSESNSVKFGESADGVAEIIEDTAIAEADPARAPLKLKVKLIKPGFGNLKDNHWYDPDVLKRDAKVFEGAKMHIVNHDPAKKSEATEVSVVEKILGFDDAGAPIAQVAVFDPYFAEKCRNREAQGYLETLECSILGQGTSRPFEKDGRVGKFIESITAIESVDWVTRAGAGGHALQIAESANSNIEGGNMPEQENVEVTTTIPVTETPAQTATEPVAEQTATPAPQPAHLSEVEVTNLLEADKTLSPLTRVKLSERQYETAEALAAAVTTEKAYLKELLGSGQPFAMGATNPAPALSLEERQKKAIEALDRTNQKYFHGGK